MRGFEPAGQYLRVDCPQVLARTSAQSAGEADEIISRCWRAARPRCRRQVLARTSAQGASEADQVVGRRWRAARPRCRRSARCRRSVGGLWGRRPPDNLEFRLFRSAAGKPASDRTHLTVFQWLPPILFGCLALGQACAARCGLGWCHQGWRRHQRQERQTCQEGSHRYPHNPIRQSAFSARAAARIYRLVSPRNHATPPVNSFWDGKFRATPECQRLTVCLRKELGRERRLAEPAGV
jgi:hypothetical protein